MQRLIKLCSELDSRQLFKLSDSIFFKFAEKEKDILDKRILIPSEVRKNAEDAYKERLKDLKFGSHDEYELARTLFTRTYLEIDKILDIHKYTFENRYKHSKSKKNPTYWEWMLYGGDEGKKWSSDIIRIYLPKKWKPN